MDISPELVERAEDRMRQLSAHADLYEEIAEFMEALTQRTFDDYDSKRNDPHVSVLIAKHRTAMNIRDDYRGLVRGNREDVEIYREFAASQNGGSQ